MEHRKRVNESVISSTKSKISRAMGVGMPKVPADPIPQIAEHDEVPASTFEQPIVTAPPTNTSQEFKFLPHQLPGKLYNKFPLELANVCQRALKTKDSITKTSLENPTNLSLQIGFNPNAKDVQVTSNTPSPPLYTRFSTPLLKKKQFQIHILGL